jgi:hypothetical protein
MLATLILLLATAAPAKAPAIAVRPAAHDFGKARPQQTLRKEFSVENGGTADLLIEGVSTTCGCTAAVTGDKQVAPGGSTHLTVTLETREARGRLVRRVLVRSNDPKTPVVEVTVSATVETAGK